ncbi:hypothetical protein AB1Y20_008078 [Prymnesium parvum]|uniref:Ribosome recycling factor domain-containing protein n=1 Tax=Prymnesium parvum TaxID=97485 RepID=A0AB34IVU5_PRYPA
MKSLAALLASLLAASALRVGVTPSSLVGKATCATRRLCHPVVMEEDLDKSEAALEALMDAEEKMKKSIMSVREQLATLRVGRASPALLDRVMVDYYDVPTPLNQLASVSAPTPTQLVVDVYDKSSLGDVEKALMLSDLGMMPSNDGKLIRLNVPALTAERRKEFAKTAKSLGEEGKVAIRNVRKATLDKIKKLVKDGLGEDEGKDRQEELQAVVKKSEAEVDAIVKKKEEEILTV